jgi:hypothetical protein
MVESVQIVNLTISGNICRVLMGAHFPHRSREKSIRGASDRLNISFQPLNKVKIPICERSSKQLPGKGRSPAKAQLLKPSACFDVAD